MRLAARMPLSWLHFFGAVLGRAVYACSPGYARRFRENLAASGIAGEKDMPRLLQDGIAEAGKGVTEVAKVWFGGESFVSDQVRCDDLAVLEPALAAGKGVIFLTPHLGCFEVSALFGAQRMPITVLYRPPRIAVLESVMQAGRSRRQACLAPANVQGVRRLLKALRRGEAVGILPDQVPGFGEGEWAPFFGRPAYTMTLVSRLQAMTGAAVIMAVAKRLPQGRGYHLHLQAVPDRPLDAVAVNRAVEAAVKSCPAQYFWGYNRYKVPAGVAPPGQEQ